MKIGIDIGGSHIGIGIINRQNKIEKKIEREIEKNNQIKDYILRYIDYNINKIMQKEKIELIGIAMPGNPRGATIDNIVNLGIETIDFQKIIDKYNVPFKIKNDSKAAAIAEKRYGSLVKYKDSVFLCLGTGIGSAVFLNGKLLQSNRNIGFELGHMIIDKNGLECNCGKRGCFETYCSIKKFKESAKKILNAGELVPEELINRIKKDMHNTEIKNIINEYINNLIIGLSNIIDIFEPQAICLGGSFVYFKDIFYKRLIEEINERKYIFNKKSMPEIVLAELKNDAGIIGAVL